MNKLILLLVALSFVLLAQSQISKTVNVTAGGLSAALSRTELTTVTNLTVTGTIDARDFVTMRDSATALTNINLSGASISANTIPLDAFANCSRLTSITIPSSVTTIASRAFRHCFGLTSIIIPSSVTIIANEVFWGCTGLTSITIPSSVTYIGVLAFCDCAGLTSVIIPSSVTFIGVSAFEDCAGLTSISIPSSVSNIVDYIFYNCTGLTSIYENSILPPSLYYSANVFCGVNRTTCTLYVPTGSKNAYQAADQWKDFTNIVEMTTALPTITNDAINIYPNPITDSFQISGFDGSVLIVIRDLNGEILLKKQVNENEKININSLSKGIYMVEINTGEGLVLKKIIKE